MSPVVGKCFLSLAVGFVLAFGLGFSVSPNGSRGCRKSPPRRRVERPPLEREAGYCRTVGREPRLSHPGLKGRTLPRARVSAFRASSTARGEFAAKGGSLSHRLTVAPRTATVRAVLAPFQSRAGGRSAPIQPPRLLESRSGLRWVLVCKG